MRYYRILFSIILYWSLSVASTATAQTWNFIKEKDGIKIYTREESGNAVKSFKGVADIDAPAEKVFALMEDVNNTSWWDKNLSQIRVLQYEKNRKAQYYIVYDLPWPVTDRDLCAEATITIDPVSGERRISAVSLPGVIPEKKDMVRIKNYRQSWKITPSGKEKTHVELEGLVDPAGAIPEWISNILLVDSPFKSISGIKEQMEK